MKHIPIYKQSQSRYHVTMQKVVVSQNTKRKTSDAFQRSAHDFNRSSAQISMSVFNGEKKHTCSHSFGNIQCKYAEPDNGGLSNINFYLLQVVTFLWKTICESLHPVACRVCLNKKTKHICDPTSATPRNFTTVEGPSSCRPSARRSKRVNSHPPNLWTPPGWREATRLFFGG